MNTNSDNYSKRVAVANVDSCRSSLLETLDSIDSFNLSDTNQNVYNCYETISIHMNGQKMIEEIMISLLNILNVNILYEIMNNTGKLHKAVAYSTPYADELFVIHLESVQYGVVENMEITFFESLENMYDHLKKDLEMIYANNEQEMSDTRVVRLQTVTELLANFI